MYLPKQFSNGIGDGHFWDLELGDLKNTPKLRGKKIEMEIVKKKR